jgi:hypothetical protein
MAGGKSQPDADGMQDASGLPSSSSPSPSVPLPSGPLAGTVRPVRFTIADPPTLAAPCATKPGGQITASAVLVGQTHLLSPDAPFLTVSANRPLTVAVQAVGTGEAPSGSVTAKLDGKEFKVCLEGSATLAAADAALPDQIYKTSIPAEWVKPGLSVSVAFGAKVYEQAIDVKAENGITLVVVDALLFADGTQDKYGDEVWREFAARLPFSYIDVVHNPFGIWSPKEWACPDSVDSWFKWIGNSTNIAAQTRPAFDS